MNCVLLSDDRPYSSSANDSPYEKGDTGDRHKIRFDGEKMPDFVDGKPNGRKRTEPEDEKGDPIGRRRPGALRECVRDLLTVLGIGVNRGTSRSVHKAPTYPALPDRSNHDIDAVSSDIRLNAVPNAS